MIIVARGRINTFVTLPPEMSHVDAFCGFDISAAWYIYIALISH